jgi:hypothetical protein
LAGLFAASHFEQNTPRRRKGREVLCTSFFALFAVKAFALFTTLELVKDHIGFSGTLKSEALWAAHGTKTHSEKLFPRVFLIRVEPSKKSDFFSDFRTTTA